MQKLRVVISIVLAIFAPSAFAQLEMRLAYTTEKPDTIPTIFPNDPFFKFMASTPFVSSSELRRATVSQHDGSVGQNVRITNSARKKFNRLAAANTKSLARQDGHGEFVGIAILVDGRVRSVIQGVHHLPIPDIALGLFDDRLPLAERLQEARALALRINNSAGAEHAGGQR